MERIAKELIHCIWYQQGLKLSPFFIIFSLPLYTKVVGARFFFEKITMHGINIRNLKVNNISRFANG